MGLTTFSFPDAWMETAVALENYTEWKKAISFHQKIKPKFKQNLRLINRREKISQVGVFFTNEDFWEF